jgi:1,6-anhydro-N-acetylmuramate kinase
VPKRAAAADDLASRIEAVRQTIATKLPSAPRIDELVLYRTRPADDPLLGALSSGLAQLQVLEATRFGIPAGGLHAAGVALLGLLNLDQVPAAATAITGARAPRVLGRLTPGSLANWHRLVRELASARPSVVSLRSAV